MLCKDVGRDQAARLLGCARDAVKPVPPKRLGGVGPQAFPAFAYAIAQGNAKFGSSEPSADIPFVVEAWARTSDGDVNDFTVCINRTPVAAKAYLSSNKTDLNAFGCGLRRTVATAPKAQSFVVWLNVISPYVPITSDGKEPNLKPFVDAIVAAISKAVRKVRRPGAGAVSQKDVVLAYLDEVIGLVSGGALRYRFNERQVFYPMRPIVLRETGRELLIGNFKSIITDYEAERGEIELMYREPRGSITHPHSGETITLGTLMVENYERPV
jgi:hypothetical protein